MFQEGFQSLYRTVDKMQAPLILSQVISLAYELLFIHLLKPFHIYTISFSLPKCGREILFSWGEVVETGKERDIKKIGLRQNQ